ncbi:RICIN domain-containing protein [Nonomuraea sp. NPDC049400]|uniref:RICIN domain-containing protein n=1 Tax=Nonomuraea sp. NPDC049400 TaxID=3364352 RepID=UPI00378B7FD6
MRAPIRRALVSVLTVLATVVTTLVAAAPAQAATYYTIMNRASGKCLAIGGGDQSNGAHAIQWPCSRDYSAEQRWFFTQV